MQHSIGQLQNLYRYIDHTALKPTTTFEDIQILFNEAHRHGCPAICIPACYVSKAHLLRIQTLSNHTLISDTRLESGSDLDKNTPEKPNYAPPKICTVIGFPLGYESTDMKASQAKLAIADGADEIDVVINLGMVKSGAWQDVQDELQLLRNITANQVLKVIIEGCYLSTDEIIKLCDIITAVKADYIKTSTGFGSGGATLEMIELFKQHIGPDVKIKAAGGIRTVEDIQTYIEAGCDRIGSSAGLQAIEQTTGA